MCSPRTFASGFHFRIWASTYSSSPAITYPAVRPSGNRTCASKRWGALGFTVMRAATSSRASAW